jgi:hypothetical protein
MHIIIAEDPYLTQTYLRTNPGPTTLNAFTPQFLAAEKKCSALGFARGFVTTPAQIQQHVKREIAQVNCMRQHGFPDMPDPSPQAAMGLPAGIDPNSPLFRAAQKRRAAG